MYMVHVINCPQCAGSEPERHDLCSATNLNYTLSRTRTKFGESLFCFWAHCLDFGTVCLIVRQTVADSDWLPANDVVSAAVGLVYINLRPEHELSSSTRLRTISKVWKNSSWRHYPPTTPKEKYFARGLRSCS